LLAQSREKNASLGITGLLVYGKREFIQLLEGNKKDIFDRGGVLKCKWMRQS